MEMPELPEVETLCRQMSSVIMGAKVRRVDILDARLGRGRNLKGRQVLSVARQGKGVIIKLDEGLVIRLHLRMTGRLLWRETCRELLPHTRLTIAFDRGRLDLIDPRRFATLSFEESPECRAPVCNPLEDFDADVLIKSAARRRLPVKSFLLDQKAIAGIGNIYACEILHAAAVDPFRRADSLSKPEWRKVAAAAGDILAKAVACRGTSVSDWLDLFGRKAEYQKHLRVYGRAGKGCSRCRGVIIRERLGGRGTFYCPACQH
jgi:formamidopyrimidine-DNA glycosylase